MNSLVLMVRALDVCFAVGQFMADSAARRVIHEIWSNMKQQGALAAHAASE